jgi:hypothetical protein
MKAFAVFTLHAPEDAAWIEEGCAHVAVDPTKPDHLWESEAVGNRLAVLRKKYGAALGDMAREDAAAIPGGIVLEFDNPKGWPESGECYAALRALNILPPIESIDIDPALLRGDAS